MINSDAYNIPHIPEKKYIGRNINYTPEKVYREKYKKLLVRQSWTNASCCTAPSHSEITVITTEPLGLQKTRSFMEQCFTRFLWMTHWIGFSDPLHKHTHYIQGIPWILRILKFGTIHNLRLNSFPASGNFYCLLITFGNSLDPDQKCWAWSGSKLFDTLMVFLKDFYKKVNFKKKSPHNKKACKIT